MCSERKRNVLTYYDCQIDLLAHAFKSLGFQDSPVAGILRVNTVEDRRESADYLVLLSSKGKFGPNRPERIGWASLEREVSRCLHSHTKCRVTERLPIPGLRVIDCKRRVVTLASENCAYLALSYVWGTRSGSEDDYVFPTLPKELDRTIEDAMTATIRLGYRYLWVDKYCIDQRDASAKHQQIRQMWGVYETAQVTLIAAAGDCSTYGLPGASLARTKRSWSVARGPVSLSSRYATEAIEVAESVWASRAWTFQENFISPRRLFFTESSAFFVCKHGLRTEDGAAGAGLSRMFSGIPTTLGSHEILALSLATTVTYEQPYKRRSGARRCIEAYCARNLSYETDALDAILGVLTHLAQDIWNPIYHIWGLPVAAIDPTGPFQRRFAGCHEVSLHWYHPEGCRRRTGFPSWSPISWEGPLNFTGDLNCMNTVPMVPSDYGVNVIGPNERHTLRQYIETGRILRDSAQHHAPRLLQLANVRTFLVAFEQEALTKRAVLRLTNHVDVVVPVFWDQEPLEVHTTILLGAVISTYQHGDVSILLLQRVQNIYRRVGMILWGYRTGTYTVHNLRSGERKIVRSARDRLVHPPQFAYEKRQDITIE
jgi:hypothetical protein